MREYFVWLAKLITILLLLFIVVPILIGVLTVGAGMVSGLGEKTSNLGSKNRVAVVELTGMIDSAKDILEELHEHAQDDDIKGIVLRIDSPGGAVAPSQEVYAAVRKLKAKKPIVASMGALAASGGLYAALGASKVYSQPGTLTGSIGVIFQVPNLSKIAEKVGVDVVTVKSGKYKDVGNMFRAMTNEDREFLQETVLKVYEDFVAAVSEGRNIPREKVVEFADGRVIVGSDAKRYGLVDEFGDVYDAARAVFELRGEALAEGENPNVIFPSKKFKALEELLGGVDSLLGIFNPQLSNFKIQYLIQ